MQSKSKHMHNNTCISNSMYKNFYNKIMIFIYYMKSSVDKGSNNKKEKKS